MEMSLVVPLTQTQVDAAGRVHARLRQWQMADRVLTGSSRFSIKGCVTPRFLVCVPCNGLGERLSVAKEWSRMPADSPLAWPAIAAASRERDTSRYDERRIPSHHATTDGCT